MNRILSPGKRTGKVKIPSSKSVAHRLLICAALSEKESEIGCTGISRDISATMECLETLGASFDEGIRRHTSGINENTQGSETGSDENTCKSGTGIVSRHSFTVKPICRSGEPGSTGADPGMKMLHCGESGSTLRFLLPIVSALGVNAVFCPEGRLYERPMDELLEQLKAKGAVIEKRDGRIYCSGKLGSGDFRIPGNVSSQYISGLLFALPLLNGDSRLKIEGRIESSSYIELTEDALKKSGIEFEKDRDGYSVPGNQKYDLTGFHEAEGDWSNAAFFLCMGALSEEGIEVSGLNAGSKQGDKDVLRILEEFGAEIRSSDGRILVRRKELKPLIVDASEIPDLVPAVSVMLAGAEGLSEIRNAERLRIKESDRISSTVNMLNALGGRAEETRDGLRIYGRGNLTGGVIDAENDHRIAMSAAVAASLCERNITVPNGECADKSYPSFWDDLDSLKVL